MRFLEFRVRRVGVKATDAHQSITYLPSLLAMR